MNRCYKFVILDFFLFFLHYLSILYYITYFLDENFTCVCYLIVTSCNIDVTPCNCNVTLFPVLVHFIRSFGLIYLSFQAMCFLWGGEAISPSPWGEPWQGPPAGGSPHIKRGPGRIQAWAKGPSLSRGRRTYGWEVHLMWELWGRHDRKDGKR